MRGYGLPRNDDVANPDKADGLYYGLNGFHIKSDKKTRARRIWAGKERQKAKRDIRSDVEEM